MTLAACTSRIETPAAVKLSRDAVEAQPRDLLTSLRSGERRRQPGQADRGANSGCRWPGAPAFVATQEARRKLPPDASEGCAGNPRGQLPAGDQSMH